MPESWFTPYRRSLWVLCPLSIVLLGVFLDELLAALNGGDIELQLWGLFPEADCMIYGHTHRPVCHRQGGVLFINPGIFRATGPYGAPGTYAILEAGNELRAAIHQVQAGQ